MRRPCTMLAMVMLACGSNGSPSPRPTSRRSQGVPSDTQPPAPPPPATVPPDAGVRARQDEPDHAEHPVIGYTREEGCLAGRLEARGLPAVSADGQRVAIALRALDGGRGNPNLEVQVREVARDSIVERHPLLTADEFDAAPCDELTARIEPRIRRVNELLAAGSWQTMTALEVNEESPTGGLASAQVDGVELMFREPRFVVRIPTVRVLFDRASADWSAPRGRRCPGCALCAPTAVLDRLHLDRERGIVVVGIEYRAGDLCDTDGVVHVVQLPPAARDALRAPAASP